MGELAKANGLTLRVWNTGKGKNEATLFDVLPKDQKERVGMMPAFVFTSNNSHWVGDMNAFLFGVDYGKIVERKKHHNPEDDDE